MILRIFVLFLALLVWPGCIDHGTYRPGQEQEEEQLTEAVLPTEVGGLSGLCYNAGKTGLLAVSDKTGIYELNFDGQTVGRGPNPGKDFEGITVDYSTGTIYVVEERQRAVYKMEGGQSALTRVGVMASTGTDDNKGLEGVSYDQAGHLYISNQENPWLIIKYSVAEGREVSRTGSLKQYFRFISDICYDISDGTMWIVDSKSKKVFHCSVDGVPFEFQEINMIDKAEALLVDRSRGVMWVGDDTTGKIYRIKLDMQAI